MEGINFHSFSLASTRLAVRLNASRQLSSVSRPCSSRLSMNQVLVDLGLHPKELRSAALAVSSTREPLPSAGTNEPEWQADKSTAVGAAGLMRRSQLSSTDERMGG